MPAYLVMAGQAFSGAGGNAALAGAMILPADLAREFGFVGQRELRLSTVWLSVYIFALVQAALMLVPLRVSGQYPLSAMALNIAALTEIAVLALCVTQSQSYVFLAAALVGLRCLTAVAIGAIAYRYAPEVFPAPAVPLRPTLRQLLRPSLAFIIRTARIPHRTCQAGVGITWFPQGTGESRSHCRRRRANSRAPASWSMSKPMAGSRIRP